MLVRAMVWVLDVIPLVSWALIAAELLIFAPLSFTRRMRGIAQFGFALSASLLALMLWMSSAFAVYAYHGLATLILSTIFVGVPTVLIAGFESGIHRDWYSLIGMVVMITAIAGAAFGFAKCGRDPRGTAPEGFLPTMFVDPPGPYSPMEELQAFLRETEDLIQHPEIRLAREEVLGYVRRRESGTGQQTHRR